MIELFMGTLSVSSFIIFLYIIGRLTGWFLKENMRGNPLLYCSATGFLTICYIIVIHFILHAIGQIIMESTSIGQLF